MSTPKAYVRPTTGWWLRHPVYRRYMLREATAVFVFIYALVLLSGLWSLTTSEESYLRWLEWLSSPVSMVIHVMALAAALYHTVTWFKVSPKVAPALHIGGVRLPDGFISGIQYVIAILCYAVLLLLAWHV